MAEATLAPERTARGKGIVLDVANLDIGYRRRGQILPVVSDLSFQIAAGEAFGLVGESGCGKSTVALTLMRYLARNGRVTGGTITLDGENLLSLDQERLRRWRGKKMAMVYQEPGSALNPSIRVGEQIAEVFRFHESSSRDEARERAKEVVRKVALADPDRIMRRYPHQLSGGQQQRVVIAMALAGNPQLLILDEPTTGLDATVEAEVLDLIAALRADFDAAILFISHNLGLIARMCERVGVLYAGRMVEEGPAREVFTSPRHPYTLGLVRCVPRFGAAKNVRRLEPIPGSLPRLGADIPGCYYEPRCPLARSECREAEPALFEIGSGRRARCYFHEEVPAIPARDQPVVEQTVSARTGNGEAPLLELKNMVKRYDEIVACDHINLELRKGEIFGLVGESGSGKTTLARVVAGLVEADGGDMLFEQTALPRKVGRRSGRLRRAVQMVFQNPDTTLNPKHTTKYVLQRSIDKLGGKRDVHDLAREVRLELRQLEAKSQQLSGGQKQRVAIARAFAGSPELVLCDEPVSALDVSVQAAILNLLAELQVNEEVSYIFISHDLAVVRYLADRIGVMYLGDVVELGTAEQVFQVPQHPYTEALLSAIPTLDLDQPRERIRLTGPMPSLANLPTGCRFHTRCPRKIGAVCETDAPPWRETADGKRYRCHHEPEALVQLQGQTEHGRAAAAASAEPPASSDAAPSA
jgi:peptide/nickel transport system ATP-binding protein